MFLCLVFIALETHAAVSKKYFKAWHAKKGMKALLKKNEENSNSADESEPFEDGEKPLLSGEKIEVRRI